MSSDLCIIFTEKPRCSHLTITESVQPLRFSFAFFISPTNCPIDDRFDGTARLVHLFVGPLKGCFCARRQPPHLSAAVTSRTLMHQEKRGSTLPKICAAHPSPNFVAIYFARCSAFWALIKSSTSLGRYQSFESFLTEPLSSQKNLVHPSVYYL